MKKSKISSIFLIIILNFHLLLPFSIGFDCPFNSNKLLPSINGIVDTNFSQLSAFPLMVVYNTKTLNVTLYFANNETHFYSGVKLFNGSASNEGFSFDVILYDGTTIDRKYVSYDSLDGPLGTDELVDAYYDGALYDFDPDFHIDGLGAINLTYSFSESQYFYQGEILFPLRSGHPGDIQVDSNQEVSIAFMFYFQSTLYCYPAGSHNTTAVFHPNLSRFSQITLTITEDSGRTIPPEDNTWMYILILSILLITISAISIMAYLRTRRKKND